MAHDGKVIIICYLVEGRREGPDDAEIEHHAGYFMVDNPEMIIEDECTIGDKIAFLKYLTLEIDEICKQAHPDLVSCESYLHGYDIVDKSDPELLIFCLDKYQEFLRSGIKSIRRLADKFREDRDRRREIIDQTNTEIEKIVATQKKRRNTRKEGESDDE